MAGPDWRMMKWSVLLALGKRWGDCGKRLVCIWCREGLEFDSQFQSSVPGQSGRSQA
jgi:hypothetical protein